MKKHLNIEAGKKFKTIFEEGPLGMYTTDLAFRFIDVNNKFCEMTGYSVPELMNISFSDFTYKEDIELDLFMAKRLYKGEVPHYSLRKRYIRKDGDIYWINQTTTLIRDKKEFPLYFLTMVEDINDSVKNNIKLREREAELSKLNADKDTLFSIIAHDLRSPFTTLQGFTEILMEDLNELTKEEITQYLRAIYSSSKNLMNLLDNLLNWSRINTGNIQFSPESVSINKLIKDIVRVFTYTGKNKNVEIRVDLVKEMSLYCDRNMISTILRNLLSNALKFTTPGGTIVISTAILKDNFQFSVKDNGIGMEPDKIEKLLTASRVMSSRGTHDESGTGLGFKLIREFVTQHSGSLKVDSKPGRGSNFIVTIPILEDPK